MSDFVALYTAFSGLQAAQAAIDTTAHNIANAGNEGYTRQRVELASRLPYPQPFGVVGTGVDVSNISRARQELLDIRFRASSATQNRMETLGSLLDGVEATLGEPDAGITPSLSTLWAAFEDLALDPPDTASRQGVINALDGLTRTIRGIAEAWDVSANRAAADLAGRVAEVNDLAAEVARVNEAIVEAEGAPGTPNDLLDTRDMLLDRLAGLTGARATVTESGSIRVSVNGLALVHDAVASSLSFDPATNTITHSSGAVLRPGGELAGFHSFLTIELTSYQASLDALAVDIADALNTQHAAGFTSAGAAGAPLLTYLPGSAAITINVAITDPADVAVSAGGPPIAPFDGDNAAALGDLRYALVGNGGAETLGEVTRSLVSGVGGGLAAALQGAAAQGVLTTAAANARQQAHGVSIDEEMVNLITYQRAYEAAARAMTAVDEALDTLINRTGLVGR